MINDLTPKERNIIAHAHIEVLDEQSRIYQTFMRYRFFTGDFPKEKEAVYIINVVESIYEETMELDRSIVAPSGYNEVYEYILSKSRRFGRETQYTRVRVYPVVYHPVPGDIVTLPAHLMVQAAKHDTRILSPTNWEMEVVDVTDDASIVYTYKNENPKATPLFPKSIDIIGPVPIVKPRGTDMEPFTFPKVPLNHYILLYPAKEEKTNDTIGK